MLTGNLPVGRFEAPSETVSLVVRVDEIVLWTLERDPSDATNTRATSRPMWTSCAVTAGSAIPGRDGSPKKGDSKGLWNAVGFGLSVSVVVWFSIKWVFVYGLGDQTFTEWPSVEVNCVVLAVAAC